jgi:hypothetical protein
MGAADCFCPMQAEPVKGVAEPPVVFICGASENPIGDDICSPAAAIWQQSGAGRQHKAKGHRLNRFHLLAQKNHSISQYVLIQFLCHFQLSS